jgi:hypothetical protein
VLAVAVGALSAPALAQTPLPPVDFLTPTPGVLGFMAEQPPTSMRLSKIKGTHVIGLDERKLGEIEDVLVDRTGRAQAVVIDAGGLIGGKTVALPYGEFLWNTGPVGRTAAPSASLHPADALPAPATTAADRMPGAEVSARALNAVPEGRSGTVDPSTGPVTTGAVDTPSATVLVASGEGPVRAVARMTTADIQSAPEFRYAD